jgi:hypothetical protein
LSRIKILAQCYTNSNLEKEILEYQDMMYSFAELASNGGSQNLHQQIKWNNGLPTYEDFAVIIQGIEKQIIAKLDIK